MPRRCLVTGGTGFIGQVLTRQLLARGDQVRTVSRHERSGDARVDHHRIDLSVACELPSALMRDVDTVFHLAGKAHAVREHPDPNDAEYTAANVDATRLVLCAAVAAGVRSFVFFSTAKAAGSPRGRDGVPLDELESTPPDTPYGRSKQAAEELVLDAGRRHGMHVCNLRPVLVYGPGVKGNLHKMLRAVDRVHFPPVPELGNRRSLVSVDDVSHAALLAADDPAAAGQVFLLTDGQAYSTRRLYTATAAALGRPVPRVTVPVWMLSLAARLGDAAWRLTGRRAPIDSASLDRLTESAWYTSEKISRTLGYQPRLTFESALPAMVAKYRDPA